MRKPANPFVLSGYHSPGYFCDREEELKWLFDQFDNERNSVIYSRRRMGKTALINHFFHHLEKKKSGQGVFLDLLGTTNISEANRKIAGAIVQKFGNLQKGIGAKLARLMGAIGAKVGLDPVTGAPEISIGLQQKEEIPHSLEAIGRYLSDEKKPIVICVDEFQQIVNYPEKNVEATFRAWTQSFPMIRFIFSGSHRQMMISMFSEASRPFYRSAQLLHLDPIEANAYREFIISFFKRNKQAISDDHIKSIFDWTRMQTYYVQLVCNKLYGRGTTIDWDTIEEVFHEIVQQEVPLFSSMQQLFTSFQWKLLRAIAREEYVANPLSKDFIGKHHLGAASSVSTALNNFLEKDFVLKEHDEYTIQDTLFMRYIQQL